MKIVSNTTPLIGLAKIGRFDLIRNLFGKIYIPNAVYDEVVTAGRMEGGAKREVIAADWILTRAIQDQLAVNILLDELDYGEAEAIVLAYELGADLVLMDEKKGRRKLEQLGLQKIGTLGILIKAKNMGYIQNVKNEMQCLRESGFSISESVFKYVLVLSGEK